MTTINYNFKIDGDFDSVNYYRSNSPMDEGLMPAPLTTGITAKSYTDTTAESNRQYYVRFGSIREGIEKISNEIIASTEDLTDYSAFFELSSNFLDSKGGIPFIPSNPSSVYFAENSVHFDGTGNSFLGRAGAESTTFGDGSLTVVCDFKSEVIGSRQYDQALIDNFVNGEGGWQIGITPSGNAYLYMNTPNTTAIRSTASYLDGNWHRIKWTRLDDLNTLYVDDVVVGTYTDRRYFAERTVYVGAQVGSRNLSYNFVGLIKNVGFAKRVI